jgi:hypothetical protein
MLGAFTLVLAGLSLVVAIRSALWMRTLRSAWWQATVVPSSEIAWIASAPLGWARRELYVEPLPAPGRSVIDPRTRPMYRVHVEESAPLSVRLSDGRIVTLPSPSNDAPLEDAIVEQAIFATREDCPAPIARALEAVSIDRGQRIRVAETVLPADTTLSVYAPLDARESLSTAHILVGSLEEHVRGHRRALVLASLFTIALTAVSVALVLCGLEP